MKYLVLSVLVLACVVCARQAMPGSPAAVAAAQVRVQAGPGVAVPYARPDLSADPQERANAYAMREALAAQDFRAARKLATTRALREMYNEAQHERAVLLRNT